MNSTSMNARTFYGLQDHISSAFAMQANESMSQAALEEKAVEESGDIKNRKTALCKPCAEACGW